MRFFPSRRLNKLVGNLVAWICFTDFKDYQLNHKIHHLKTGLVEIRNDKDGNLASTIGRKSFSSEKLLENYKHFIESLKKEKPDTIKGEFIKGIYITSTMGISYKVGGK